MLHEPVTSRFPYHIHAAEPRPGGVAAHPPDWHLTLLRHLLDGSGCGNALALLIV